MSGIQLRIDPTVSAHRVKKKHSFSFHTYVLISTAVSTNDVAETYSGRKIRYKDRKSFLYPSQVSPPTTTHRRRSFPQRFPHASWPSTQIDGPLIGQNVPAGQFWFNVAQYPDPSPHPDHKYSVLVASIFPRTDAYTATLTAQQLLWSNTQLRPKSCRVATWNSSHSARARQVRRSTPMLRLTLPVSA